MKTSYIFNKKTKNNITLLKALPKIDSSVRVLNTSPNKSSKLKNFFKNCKHISTTYAPYKMIRTDNAKTKRKLRNSWNRQNKTIEILHKLNLDSKIKDIYTDILKKEKKRETINTNKEIIERRLGLYKDMELNLEEEKDKEKEFQYYNELSLEKLSEKEKEKNAERNYKQSLKDLEVLEKNLAEKDNEIKELKRKIDNEKLDLNVIDHFGRNIDKKNFTSETPIKKISDEKYSTVIKTPLIHKPDAQLSLAKNEDFEFQAKLLVKKYQRDEKQKLIQSVINEDEKKMQSLQKEKNALREKFNSKKKKINEFKKELINIFHSKLFEGLDFRGDGIVKMILNIWNLGEDIDMNFIPPFLDKDAVDFLFKKARLLVEMSKIKKLIAENEKDFLETLRDWKNDNHLDLNNSDNRNKINYFFKTKVHNLKDNSILESYPKTKIFMNNYKKSKENENEENDKKINKNKLKSYEIPNLIMDKNRKVERAKALLRTLQKQMDKDEKNEVTRLSKEFLFNNYEKKYKVCIDTIIGALVGEQHQDDMLNLYYKILKENKDNLKLIEFYSPLSDRIKGQK